MPPPKDMATTTGAYVLSRALGGTVGVSIGQAVISSVRHAAGSLDRRKCPKSIVLYSQELRKRVAPIPGLTIDTSPSALAQTVIQIPHIAVSRPTREG